MPLLYGSGHLKKAWVQTLHILIFRQVISLNPLCRLFGSASPRHLLAPCNVPSHLLWEASLGRPIRPIRFLIPWIADTTQEELCWFGKSLHGGSGETSLLEQCCLPFFYLLCLILPMKAVKGWGRKMNDKWIRLRGEVKGSRRISQQWPMHPLHNRVTDLEGMKNRDAGE